MATDILGAEASFKNLKTKVTKLDQDALKQRGMIYAMDFNIQQLERKLKRAEGDRTDEEKEILTKRIDELTKQFDASTAKFQLLTTQLKISQEDLRHCKRNTEALQKAKEIVTREIEDLTTYNESAVLVSNPGKSATCQDQGAGRTHGRRKHLAS